MEQNLQYELVDALLIKENHARALAKNLDTNHMTVVRKLKALVERNVLDFRVEGRNKVYFLKRSIEARNYSIMAEQYKLNKALEKYPELRKIAERIQGNEKIRLAIVFGSYAKGTAEESSDIDLFVETRDRELRRDLELLNSRLSVKIGAYDESIPLISEMDKNHVIIKGAEGYYEKKGVFS